MEKNSIRENQPSLKIVAGLGSIDDYLAYVKAGADEVFAGYVPQCWQEMYGLTTPLNRREVCYYNVQIGSESELEILADMVKSAKVPVTLAFNGLHFREEQLPMIAGILEDCLSLGFDSVILADLSLMVYLHEVGLSEKLKIHVSGEFGEIDHWMVRELQRLGASRLIFHRKVSLENMEAIIREQRQWEQLKQLEKQEQMRKQTPGQWQELPPMEFEAFILNENCHFNGAFCNSLHCDELVPMCRMPYRLSQVGKVCAEGMDASAAAAEEAVDSAAGQTEEANDNERAEDFGYDYGLKDLGKMKAIGITHLKVVGRGADGEYMTRCIQRVSEKVSREVKSDV